MVSPPPDAQLTERQKLHVAVAAVLEERILSGVLQVGDKLPSESDLASQFGVSTRSVREALQVLETKGLIRRKHGAPTEVVREDVGQFLTSLASTIRSRFAQDADYLVQLMDVRRILELEAVHRLAHGGGKPTGKIEAALERMAGAVEEADYAAFSSADATFHLALIEALENEILSAFYGNLFALITDVIRVASRIPRKTLREGLEEHRTIHRLIAVGDAEAARQAMREHIENSTAYLASAIRTSQPAHGRRT